MSVKESTVGNIYLGDQIAFRLADGLQFGTVMGFGYTPIKGEWKPYLKIAEFPAEEVLVSQVERITNRVG